MGCEQDQILKRRIQYQHHTCSSKSIVAKPAEHHVLKLNSINKFFLEIHVFDLIVNYELMIISLYIGSIQTVISDIIFIGKYSQYHFYIIIAVST